MSGSSLLRVFEQILGCEAYFEDDDDGLDLAKELLRQRAKAIREYEGGTFVHEIETLCIERVYANQIYDYKDSKKGAPFETVLSYNDMVEEDEADEGE